MNKKPLWKDPVLVGMALMLFVWIVAIIYNNA